MGTYVLCWSHGRQRYSSVISRVGVGRGRGRKVVVGCRGKGNDVLDGIGLSTRYFSVIVKHAANQSRAGHIEMEVTKGERMR
jgi:hypothetical protein